MRIKAQEIAEEAKPGQFITVACGGDTYLKRPMGIFYADEKTGEIGFIYQVYGKGTKILNTRLAGEKLEVLGPLGNSFCIEDGAKSVALVGGGTGIGPMIFCASRIKTQDVFSFIGARSKGILCGEDEIGRWSKKVFVSTDDGSKGHKGFVTDLLEDFLERQKVGQVLTCGPKQMMKIVADIAAKNSVPCQVSLEEHMACGFGACLGCACETKQGEYKMVCKDGPVFRAEDIAW